MKPKMVVAALPVWGVLVLAACLAGCAGAPETSKEEAVAALVDKPPETLAILPFENNSVTEPERFEPLSKGLAAMLTTDLNKNGSALKLIERSKIQALLKEIALNQTGSVDNATAVQVGKILGAQAIAFGSFMVLGSDVRIDVRIIKVETSELIVSESIMGTSDGFVDLERRLAEKIAGSLRVALAPKQTTAGSGIEAALYFSKGLEALDRGDKEAARKFFDQCVEQDPGYKDQVEKAEEMQ